MFVLCSLVFAVATPPKATVRYFNIRGLGESIRLSLASLDIDFDEVRYERCTDCAPGITDWPTAKAEGLASGLLPFGQVPSLTITGEEGETVNLVQSLVINQYLGRNYDFYGTDAKPGTQEFESHQREADQIAGGIGDLRGKYSKLVYDADVKSKIVQFSTETLPLWLGHIERFMQKHHRPSRTHGPSPFFFEKMSFVDTMLWDVLDHSLRVDPNALDDFHLLKTFFFSLPDHNPGMMAYLCGGASLRAQRANGASSHFDNPITPPLGEGYVCKNQGKEDL
jgi:glutathione S-transferase